MNSLVRGRELSRMTKADLVQRVLSLESYYEAIVEVYGKYGVQTMDDYYASTTDREVGSRDA